MGFPIHLNIESGPRSLGPTLLEYCSSLCRPPVNHHNHAGYHDTANDPTTSTDYYAPDTSLVLGFFYCVGPRSDYQISTIADTKYFPDVLKLIVIITLLSLLHAVINLTLPKPVNQPWVGVGECNSIHTKLWDVNTYLCRIFNGGCTHGCHGVSNYLQPHLSCRTWMMKLTTKRRNQNSS